MESRHIADVEEALDLFQEAVDDPVEDEDDEDGPRKVSVRSMEHITRTLREAYAEGMGEEDLSALLERACDAEDKILKWAYGNERSDSGHFDFFPIYSENLIEDDSFDESYGNAKAKSMLKFFLETFLQDAPAEVAEKARRALNTRGGRSASYDSTLTPGEQSTPLALFKKRLPSLANADSATIALREARCEIQSKGINNPIQMALGRDVIVIQGLGGYKGREGTLALYQGGLTRDQWADYSRRSVDQGHIGTPYYLSLDGSRRLVWTADHSRIKGTEYAPDGAKFRINAAHTLNSKGFEGPIALMNNGARLLRAGKSSVAIWDVDSAPTHATGRGSFVGKRLSSRAIQDSWREDSARIERSEGSPPDTTVDLDESVRQGGIELWASHPSQPNKLMLCASGKNNYNVFALDVETGTRASRYFGHGAHATSFSTTPTDANLFLTSCDDGCTRLYDVRCAVPSITLFSGEENSRSSVLLASGGGLYAFAGGKNSEQIKLWDIRAQSALYELATGNNHVVTLAWDETNTTLYACTDCPAMDGNGARHGYRRARIKKPRQPQPSDEEDEDEDMEDEDEEAEEDEEDEDEDGEDGEDELEDDDEEDEEEEEEEDSDEYYDYDGRSWPENANHDENSFGIAFDAGNHRLFRYVFKADADVTVLPEYGTARASQPNRQFGW